MKFDTIAAIATGMTAAGISVIRISGDQAFSIAEKIFRKKTANGFAKESSDTWASHTVHYGFLFDGEEIVDEVMMLVLRAPKTFTREDTIELDCHGGIVVTRRVLALVLQAGARLAEPGEFTERAFLNGRIDLSQAEAVMDVISAKNQLSLKNSMNQLRGNLKEEITALRGEILREASFIEAALDDPEHISLDGYPEQLEIKLKAEIKRLEKLLMTAENGRLLKEGIRTVILGKPNAGKSSLMNAFLGENRAIVTDIAGTTRDTLVEEIRFRGITLILVDTAGIRDTEDVVEKIGVEMARKEAVKADLLIYVVDASVALDENDEQIAASCKGRPMLTLLNKTDLIEQTTEEQVKSMLDRWEIDGTILKISAKERKGFDELEETIAQMFFQGEVNCQEDIIVTSERQKQELIAAKQSLCEVENSIQAGMPEDFYSIDLMNAYQALGRILGEEVDEDLINCIFREFCLGK